MSPSSRRLSLRPSPTISCLLLFQLGGQHADAGREPVGGRGQADGATERVERDAVLQTGIAKCGPELLTANKSVEVTGDEMFYFARIDVSE